MQTNTDFFDSAFTGSHDDVRRMRDANVTQFLIKMAALGYPVEFKMIPYNGSAIVAANTPLGQYRFMFSPHGELTIESVI